MLCVALSAPAGFHDGMQMRNYLGHGMIAGSVPWGDGMSVQRCLVRTTASWSAVSLATDGVWMPLGWSVIGAHRDHRLIGAV